MTAADRAVEAIKALLDAQRKALLAGDLDRLSQMPDQLARAMRAMAAQAPSRASLTQLAVAADQNARLLLAAQRGIADTRLRAHLRTPSRLTTYDAAGHQTSTARADQILTRR